MPASVIITMIVAVLAVVITIEVISVNRLPQKLIFRCDVNMELTEPGEIATLSYRIRNSSILPVMSAGVSFLLNDAVEVREDEEWIRRHGYEKTENYLGRMFTVDFFLMPHRIYEGKVKISFKHRGHHEIGKVYVECGDFLGFSSVTSSYDIPKRVVCTALPAPEDQDITAVGGYLGDVSVRRFIHEDPNLILGYREYTGYEPLKNISWAQTAKTGQLMVKNHDFTVDTDVAVVVNIEDLTNKRLIEHCLSLVRTVSDKLEENKIPYALISNGDLFSMEKGVGRKHAFGVQRRIGVSNFVRYFSFEELVERVVAGGRGSRGCIIITPTMSRRNAACVSWINKHSDVPACVLVGEEGEE